MKPTIGSNSTAPYNRAGISPKNTGMHFLPGEAVIYARKSTKTDKAARSIEDQIDICLELLQEHGTSIPDNCIYAEEPGHGGDEWHAGYIGSGLVGDNTGIGRTRPQWTKVLQGILNGNIKLLCVYSLDRAWRSAEIAAKSIDIMRAAGCQLMDRNGVVDVNSPEGRERILISAVSAQSQREHAAVNSGRGISRNIAKRKLVGNCNSLGFRSGGIKSCEVRHVPEEHEMVRRIFRAYYQGELAEEGPLSSTSIAYRLMEEGYIWTPDQHHKRAVRRTDASRHVIYDKQIRNVLTDVRYIGKQLYGGVVYDCDAFLYNGEPIVPYDLFEQVQQKVQQRKLTTPRSVNTYALSGRIRCGICGFAFISQHLFVPKRKGNKELRDYWYVRTSTRALNCQHRQVQIRKEILDSYIIDVLSPLLLAEIHERGLDDEAAVVAKQMAQLQHDLQEAERHYREELPRYHRANIDPELLVIMQEDAKREIMRLRTDLQAVTAKASEIKNVLPALQDLMSVPEASRRDAIRKVIRWIAVIPSSERVKTRWKESTPPAHHLATLVFLSSFGTYHSAIMYRNGRERPELHGNILLIRPATASEVIGGVADFPDPQAFHDGLEQSWRTRYYDWSAGEVTPGFVPGVPFKTAEHEVELAEPVGRTLGDELCKQPNCSGPSTLERLIEHRDAA